MPTLFCCILNCETESVSSKKRKIFYRLPQNCERKQLWLNQIGDRIKYGTISPNSRICNAHFATGKPNLDSSHIDYIPTIFPWSSKEDMSKSHQAVENYETKIKELEQKILAKAFMSASSDSKNSPEIEVSKIEVDDYTKLSAETDIELRSKLQKINTQSESSVATISHPIIAMANKTSVADVGNTVTLNNNLINYLINSLTNVNVPNDTVGAIPVSLNISVPQCPLNLSQNYSKIEKESTNDINKSISTCLQLENSANSEFYKSQNQNGQMFSFQIQNVISVSQNNTVATSTTSISTAEENNSRSCTCTKSSCLKLYCECFATGNICSSGCTCINCRNNNRHKEERAKIVSSYLERDPWVFNSKIDSQEVGKKHSKGCNCLKSSCLKNYCECFENKVFCSTLCRCRLCCNNEDHSYQNNSKCKDETAQNVRIYPASHTSDSLSVLSENSPRESGRKRKPSIIKSNGAQEIYEDVSSNESSEEVSVKRQQLDCEINAPGLDNDRQSGGGRSITSMDIPPVLPQEDDFTEEELALMLKFREQRSVKAESVTPPLVPPPTHSLMVPLAPHPHRPAQPQLQPHPIQAMPHFNLVNGTHFSTANSHPMTSPVLSVPTQIDGQSLLQSLSKSLAGANLGVSFVNSGSHLTGPTCIQTMPPQQHHHHTEVTTNMGAGGAKLTSTDFLNLLISQQLMVPPVRGSMPTTNYSHVIPINLTQQACAPTLAPVTAPPPMPLPTMQPSPRPPMTTVTCPQISVASSITTNIIPSTVPPTCTIVSNCCPTKNKLSTEDYVRKHIEAAERAVRADNMRRDCIGGAKKPIMKQKVKIEPQTVSPPSQKSGRSMNSGGSQDRIDECQLQGGGVASTQCNGHISTDMAAWSPPGGHWNNSRSQGELHTHSDHGCTGPNPLSGDRKWKNRYKTLRTSLHNMRTELRSIKVHMRADQSKIRRLESALLHMSNELHK